MQRDVDETRTKRGSSGEERKGVGGMNERGTAGQRLAGRVLEWLEWRAQLDQRVAKLKARAIAGGRTVTSTRYHKPRIQNLLHYSVEIFWSQPAPRIIPITQPNLWIPLLIISTSSWHFVQIKDHAEKNLRANFLFHSRDTMKDTRILFETISNITCLYIYI